MDYFLRRHHRARIVRDSIRSSVVEGNWRGHALPPDEELGRLFGVGRNVIREALQLLVDEGLLTRQQGLGTYPSGSVLLHETAALRSLYENPDAAGSSRDIHHQVLRWAEIAASPLYAASLDLADGASVIHYERLTLGSAPMIFWSTIMRADVGLERPVAPGEYTPYGFYAYLESAGLALGRALVRTSAVRADRGVAEFLKVELGSPVLLQHRRLFLADGRPLEVSTGYFRPDEIALFQETNR
ncbi:MAG: GntR family transcriptional regulator [Microbacteriaceae bacterium]|jgi:GntR family transcriptional regulator|nr:GntR family transcriptional regulator [Microbacteriaceae bacterium]